MLVVTEVGERTLLRAAFKRLDLMRSAARTRRCHTQMVIHPQGVGEHTFGTLAILDAVAPDCRKEVWRALLYHDAPEAITGDVPAPAKWKHADLETALRMVESMVKLEHGISEGELTADECQLLKYCDIMELVWYGIEELRMGNRGVIPMVQAAFGAIKKRGLGTVNDRALQLLLYSMATFESLGGTTYETG